MTDCQKLLAEYSRNGSDAAFRELVARYVDLVYSTALRLVNGDTHRAEDVAQTVFVDFARMGRRLSNNVMLGGWLHRHTCFVTANMVRGERRRQSRERQAVEMNALQNSSEADFSQIPPVLDEAINELGEADRTAILIRFFEQQDFHSIGQALGSNEDAARMRVSRALEKLEVLLKRRGVTTSAAAISAVLLTNAVQAARAGFAITISSAALASMEAGGSLTFLKLMTATKLKLGVASAVIVAGVFVVLFLQRVEHNSTTQSGSSESSVSENGMDTIDARRAASKRLANRGRQETNDSPVATAEEIVAAKLAKFGRSQRELMHALARRQGIEVPDSIERFFDAIEAGHWEEADALFKSLRYSDTDCANPRDPALGKIWRTVQETWWIAGESRNWPGEKLLEYGDAVLGSLRPGMVYVGGTDPGCFIPTMLNATSDGEQHIVLTQNALLNGDYLEYLTSVYGDRMATLTKDDGERAFENYKADAQKRLLHDQEFPDEPKQIRPGEDVRVVDGRVEVSGQVAVMAINEKLFQMLMEKNPDMSFAMEVSFPFPSTYAEATPLGPIMELRAKDEQNALSSERAAQTVDYWRATAEIFNSSPEATDSLYPRMAYAKMASEQAELLLNRGYTDEAEQTLRLANEIGSGSPEAFYRLVNLLVSQGRINDALAAAEVTYQNLPSAERMKTYYGDNPAPPGQMRTAIEDLKRLQKAK